MAVEASQDIGCNDISTAAGPSSQMVLVGCVSSFGALKSPELMLPVNMLRKQCWCFSIHPPERLPAIHLCKGLVLPRQLLDPPHPWWVHTASRVILQPLWCIFLSQPRNPQVTRGWMHLQPLHVQHRSRRCARSRMHPGRWVAASESELLHKLQGGKLGLPGTFPNQKCFSSAPNILSRKDAKIARVSGWFWYFGMHIVCSSRMIRNLQGREWN